MAKADEEKGFKTSQKLGWVIRINNILQHIQASLGTRQVALARY